MAANNPELKRILRQRVVARRRALDPETRRAHGEAIAAHLAALPAVARATRVGTYIALPDEPDTEPFIVALLERGAEVFVPVVVSDSAFHWRRLTSLAHTRAGAFGIPEPRDAAPLTEPLDVVVSPALAVDHHGTRLGRGGGYFDRVLATTACPLVAIVLDEDIVEEIAAEEHDIPVDLVVAPGGVFRPER